ncbi:unknown [Clostridium sp. CAG:470]|nr:MAG: hypothetical protein BHW03_02535 [Clostridium sp. 28_17]CDE15220.1 unknown [Clostridium sp. CAG:470]
MKICILRRDGENIHNGMIEVMSAIIEKKFGDREMFLDKNKKEFTQMITFLVSDNEDSSNIVQFIIEVLEINPLYTVRILK